VRYNYVCVAWADWEKASLAYQYHDCDPQFAKERAYTGEGVRLRTIR
jgi:hypothetical protein